MALKLKIKQLVNLNFFFFFFFNLFLILNFIFLYYMPLYLLLYILSEKKKLYYFIILILGFLQYFSIAVYLNSIISEAGCIELNLFNINSICNMYSTLRRFIYNFFYHDGNDNDSVYFNKKKQIYNNLINE